MGFFALNSIAFGGIKSNKFRTFLTLLGIIIGVSSVILMVSLGSGTSKVVSGQFQDLNTRQIYLSSNFQLPYQQRGNLTAENVNYLQNAAQGIDKIYPFYRLYFNVKVGRQAKDNRIIGALPNTDELTNLEVKYGRYLDQSDLNNRSRVAVVGETFLRELSNRTEFSNFIGQYLEIDRKQFLIIGILAEADTTLTIPDSSVIIPHTTASSIWRRQTRYYDYALIPYQADHSEKDIMEQIKYLLKLKYGLTSEGESRYYFEGLSSSVGIYSQVVTIFTYVLGGIAAISLLVGGIGVMNIMLVTVKERTREIGLRMAIGASRKEIRIQFLLESVMMAFAGGMIGVVIGVTLSSTANMLIGKYFDWWQGVIPIWVIGLSFLVTITIGVVFGYYPAFKASKLDPIDALRYE